MVLGWIGSLAIEKECWASGARAALSSQPSADANCDAHTCDSTPRHARHIHTQEWKERGRWMDGVLGVRDLAISGVFVSTKGAGMLVRGVRAVGWCLSVSDRSGPHGVKRRSRSWKVTPSTSTSTSTLRRAMCPFAVPVDKSTIQHVERRYAFEKRSVQRAERRRGGWPTMGDFASRAAGRSHRRCAPLLQTPRQRDRLN